MTAIPLIHPDRTDTALGMVLSWPTDGGRISSRFGKRSDPFTGAASKHKGLDIANYLGAPVFATAGGVGGRAKVRRHTLAARGARVAGPVR